MRNAIRSVEPQTEHATALPKTTRLGTRPWPRFLALTYWLVVGIPGIILSGVDTLYKWVYRAVRKCGRLIESGLGALAGRDTLRIRTRHVGKHRPLSEIAAEILGEYSTHVLDVGARWGGAAAWWRLNPLARLVGFEPDEAECRNLNSKVDTRREIYIPHALGSSAKKATLYFTKQPANSSLFQPDPEVAARYLPTADYAVERTLAVDLIALDEWYLKEGRPAISFMKLDTQGSELDILQGARSTLKSCLGCEIEVEFSPMYQGQHLFHEVDRFMREQGFVLWRLDGRCHYSEQPNGRVNRRDWVSYDGKWLNQEAGSGRLFWANAIYFRDPQSFAPVPEHFASLLTLASLMEACGDNDGAASALGRALLAAPAQVPTEELERKRWILS